MNVLVVDDDAADMNLILTVLKRHPQVWAVREANAPDLALAMLVSGRFKPDLLLVDIHMPRLNGFEFLDCLRVVPGLQQTPAVFLTTSCLARDVVEARQSSAALYVVKPDSYVELQAQIDRVIKKAISGDWGR